jgi:hypothetical protein
MHHFGYPAGGIEGVEQGIGVIGYQNTAAPVAQPVQVHPRGIRVVNPEGNLGKQLQELIYKVKDGVHLHLKI